MENSSRKYFVFAIVGFVLALSGLALFYFPYGALFLLVPGIVISFIGLKSDRKKGMAVAGIVIGFIGVALNLLFSILLTSTTNLVIKRYNKQTAIKKAENILTTSKMVLNEAYSSPESVPYAITLGYEIWVTYKDLADNGEIEKNIFDDGTGADGGMTVKMNTVTGEYNVTITGKINGFTLSYDGYSFTATK